MARLLHGEPCVSCATLNELFREFRAGNAVTLANSNLRAETLRGLEAGGQWRRERWRGLFTASQRDGRLDCERDAERDTESDHEATGQRGIGNRARDGGGSDG